MNKKSPLSAFFAAILIGLILASALHFGTVQASTDVSDIPKPSIPEFTVELVAHPYDVPTTYSTNPYTGETITHQGYHVENKSIEVTIKNQPFTPYTDADGHEINLYYNVRVKGHFEQDWKELYSVSSHKSPAQSSSEYTVLSLSAYYPYDAWVDYQVEAFLGYYTKYYLYAGLSGFLWNFTGELSGWSNTQTIIIGESQTPTSSPAPTSTPYQEPQQVEQELIIGVAIAVAVISAGLGLLIYLIKRGG